MSFRSAKIALEQHNLKLQDTIYTNYFARDMVLEQQQNGQRIKAGTKLPMGSKISLVLGSGAGGQEFDVPDLFGQTLSEAKQILASSGLTVGTVQPSGADDNQYVYKQTPDHLTLTGKVNHIHQGQYIDLWVQADKPVKQQKADSSAAQGY